MDASVKTKVKPKVIDDETRLEAAKYITRSIQETSYLSKEDIYQEAWIALGKRMGKAFHSSVTFTTYDMLRSFFGRYGTEAERRRFLLTHGVANEGVDTDEDRPEWENRNRSIERIDEKDHPDELVASKDAYEKMHRIMLAYSIQAGREHEFVAISEHYGSSLYVANAYGCSVSNAELRIKKTKKMLKSRFNVKDFDHNLVQ